MSLYSHSKKKVHPLSTLIFLCNRTQWGGGGKSSGLYKILNYLNVVEECLLTLLYSIVSIQ